ncbi:MAG: amidohydrolase [Hyphomicrobiales bacterium]
MRSRFCAATALGLLLATTLASAHPTQRPLLGIYHHRPQLNLTEQSGTYCVTELAPLFREAVAINASAAAAGSTGEVDATANMPTAERTPGNKPALSGKITVFTAKKIVTMDPGWPEGTAVAVMDGRILSVGTFEDLKPWLDKYPFEVDDRFTDKVIYPGFIEAHSHPVMGSLAISRPSLSYFPLRNPYGPDIPGVRSREEAIARLKQFVADTKSPDETVLTWGYDVVAMGEGFNRDELDKVSRTQPIIVWDASEHFAYANSAAISKYGATPDKLKGVTGAGTNPDGSSNGQFLGTNAARLILPEVIAELMKPEAAKKNLTYFGALMQQAGVTTVGDLFYGGVNLELEQSLSKSFYDNENAWARIVHVVDGYTLSELYGEDAVDKALDMRKQSTDRTIFNGVKFYADDAFLSLAMELQWPGYINSEKYHGLFMYETKDDFVAAMRPWWYAGFQIHVHANGSGGNQVTLDALADLQEEKPRFDHRFTFEHFGISTTAQGRRLKALGASVSTNPYYVYERADLTIPEIGTDRASLASRMKSLVDQDIAVSLHSDTPVGVPSPLLEVWVAVNRIGYDSGKVRAPAERVDVARAMRMVTVDAAYTLGQEDSLGTIETGKFADFTVLDADPQEVDAMKIKDIGVVATILGGRVTLTADTRKP